MSGGPGRALLAVTLLVGAACGDDGGAGRARPLVAEIAPAMAAVDAARGGPQQYFEVNATPQLVNLFVATDDATSAVAYVYVGGELGPAAPPAPAQGATFAAADVTFDPAVILDGDLPDADLTVFSVIGGPDGSVQY
ncbi:MAG: hypothetical protein ACRDZ2_15380, partial [Ilumatobacteraceae bacterium]